MRIEVIPGHNALCDEFVRQRPDGKLCFLTRWSLMIAETFGHGAHYLAAMEGDSVSGVLPLTLVKSRFFGARMISQAFSNYGGALTVDSQVLQSLVRAAMTRAGACGCAQLELRNLSPVSSDLTTRADKVCMYLPLNQDPEQVWSRLRSELRNRVRKAEKSNLRVSFGGPELVDEFYRIWTMRMHELGTPCYPRRLFRNLLRTFPEYTTIGIVKCHDRTVGAGFFECFNGLAECRWAAAEVRCNGLAANVLLYWAAIRHYCLQGASTFDFGRSTLGSTQYEFKRRWGAQTIPLHYQYWTLPGSPLVFVRPDDPTYMGKVETWKKLPLWLTRLMGPVVSRALA